MNLRKYVYTCLAAILLLYPGVSLKSQSTDALGSYSPYSIYGVGEIVKPGGAYNMSMGGIGVGVRDNRFINYLNPAASCARDTLAFMMDFGVVQKNTYGSNGSAKSAYNIFNMNNIALTFPIYKKSAFIIGIAPFSNTGYKFQAVEKDKDLIADLGYMQYQKYGTGSINQLFFGASMQFLKYFSIGAEAIYYFGTFDRKSNVLFVNNDENKDIYTGWLYNVHSFSGKFGIQYSQPLIKDHSLTIGATYRLGNTMNGKATRYAFAKFENSTDTVSYSKSNSRITIASELAVGMSYRVKDKWMVGVDYVYQDWSRCTFNESSQVFKPQPSHMVKAGFEIVPNRYDARYYMKRVAYRAGAYFEQSYIGLNDGTKVNCFGITFGASLPVYKWYNAISVAVDIGQRGSLKNNLVRENYVNFIININLHDVWFRKFRYE